MERHIRNRMRLENWDYTSFGAYFLTICTKDRLPLFSQIIDQGLIDRPRVMLTPYGKCVEQAIAFLVEKNADLEMCAMVIMPNHVHLLLLLRNGSQEEGASRMPRATVCQPETSQPSNKEIPKFVSSLKRFTNRQCGMKLWQDGYYDHIARDEQEFLQIWQYIDNNPARWLDDKYYV